jgi:hypothetical protein
MSWSDIARALRHAAPQGTTEGSFFVPDNHLVIPLRVVSLGGWCCYYHQVTRVVIGTRGRPVSN